MALFFSVTVGPGATMDSAQVQQIVGDEEEVDCGGDVGEVGTTAIVDPHLQYDDIFPALPDAPTTADTPLLTTNQSNKMRIGTSVVTQVNIKNKDFLELPLFQFHISLKYRIPLQPQNN